MQWNNQHFIGAKDCPFKFKGKNLVDLRRAELRPVARALKIEELDGTKNEILGKIISRAKTLELDEELSGA